MASSSVNHVFIVSAFHFHQNVTYFNIARMDSLPFPTPLYGSPFLAL